jgi:hypothetical protein
MNNVVWRDVHAQTRKGRNTMKFLCLCYYNVKLSEALTATTGKALTAALEPHYAAWQETGKLGTIGALTEPKRWKTIRSTDAQYGEGSTPEISDDPYRDKPEQIGAFFFVEANNIEEAVVVAAKHPDAHVGRFLGGGIEVCPCEA